MKKVLSLVLALVLVMGLSVTAFAATGTPIESVEDPNNKQLIDITADYTKPTDIVVNKYYVTVSWEQTGVIQYKDSQDTYTWNPTGANALTYTKDITTAADWICTDAKVAISVENKSDMSIKANCSATPTTGLTIDGSFTKSELTIASAANGLTGTGREKTDTTEYTINDVDGTITEAGTIATITVTINAAS